MPYIKRPPLDVYGVQSLTRSGQEKCLRECPGPWGLINTVSQQVCQVDSARLFPRVVCLIHFSKEQPAMAPCRNSGCSAAGLTWSSTHGVLLQHTILQHGNSSNSTQPYPTAVAQRGQHSSTVLDRHHTRWTKGSSRSSSCSRCLLLYMAASQPIMSKPSSSTVNLEVLCNSEECSTQSPGNANNTNLTGKRVQLVSSSDPQQSTVKH